VRCPPARCAGGNPATTTPRFRLGQRIHPGSALIIFLAKAGSTLPMGLAFAGVTKLLVSSLTRRPFVRRCSMRRSVGSRLTSAERRQSSLKAIRFQQGDMQ